MPGAADGSFYFGDPGDLIVAGDWNGDGRDSVGLFRPATGRVYLRYSNSAGPADREFVFGADGWVPVAGAFGL